MPTPQTGTGAGFDPTQPLPPGGSGVPQTASGAQVPTGGPGSATELRAQRDSVQKQLNDIQSAIAARMQQDPTDVATNAENSRLTALTTQLDHLTQQITATESRQATAIPGRDVNPDDKFITFARPDGTVDVQPNPNWNGKPAGTQTVQVGNHVVVVGPDGSATVAYTNEDAQNLANRQTSVAEANARTAALAQQTNDFAARAKVDLDQRVANGEDAASVRAEQAQQLAQLHEQWVEADGDARTKQQALVEYENQRHNQAQEQLSQQQIDNTRAAQQMQDATTQRGQDIAAATTQRGQDLQSQQAAAATRASLANARLQAGSSYLGNTLGTLAQLNKDVAPGSGAVGDMLIPLMNLGQSFFSQLGGLQSPSDVLGTTGAPGVTSPDGSAPQTPTTPQVGATAVTPTTAPVVTAGPTPAITPSFGGSSSYTPGAPNLPPSMQGVYTPPTPFAQSGLSEGRSMLPAFATGGVVTKPTVALVGEAGPEAIVPLANQMQTLTPQQQFFAQLGAGIAAATAQQQGAQASQVAAQGAAALGHPPEAAANPMIPGSAVPGVPPAAAAAQAQARPLAPDGSPYARPGDVDAAWQGVYAKHGLTPPGPIGQGTMPALAGAGGQY